MGARRQPERTDAAEFRRWSDETSGEHPDPDGPVVDLGCGPGWHLPLLGDGAIGLDGAAAMLARAAHHAPGRPGPGGPAGPALRPQPLAGAWADRSYVHLARALFPMALWDLHRALAVGATTYLGSSRATTSTVRSRRTTWVAVVLVVAGTVARRRAGGSRFDVDLVEHRRGNDVDQLGVWARRARTLADTVGPGMRLLLVGLNPSWVAADAGVGFQGATTGRGRRCSPPAWRPTDRDPLDLLAATASA